MLADFLNGNQSILCETEDEALTLFRWLVSKNIAWKTDSPLTSTNWDEYKEKTIYSLEYLGGIGKLCFWYVGDARGKRSLSNILKFKDIPEEDLYVIPLTLSDYVDFDNLTNHYAIRCNTETESIELCKKLGRHGVRQNVRGGICSEYSCIWSLFEEPMVYTVANKKAMYGMSITKAEAMGYKIIDFKNFKD